MPLQLLNTSSQRGKLNEEHATSESPATEAEQIAYLQRRTAALEHDSLSEAIEVIKGRDTGKET
jgi:hypothetical protein